MKKIITLTIFIAVIFFSVLNVIYFLHYDILTEHDMYIPWNRFFLQPEHGRYIATYFNNIVTQKLYYWTNIHPNDLQVTVLPVIKGILISIICLMLTYSFFLFSNKKLTEKFKSSKFTLIFTFTYILIYLMTFNDFYFFNYRQYELFFNSLENTVFFEYICSLLVYLPFTMYLFNLFVNKKLPNRIQFAILLSITFLLGITVEVINVQVMIVLFLFLLFLFISYLRNKENIGFLKYYLILFATYSTSFTIYYLSPRDNELDFGNWLTYKDYLINEFITFTKEYFLNFVPNILILSLIAIVIAYIFSAFNKNKDEKDKMFLCFLTINIFSIFVYFFLMFIFGHNEDYGIYYIEIPKWQNLYKIISLFYLTLVLGYITDKYIKDERKQYIYKFSLIIIILAVFSNQLLINYYPNMQKYRYKYQKLREIAYICEKYTRENYKKGEKITIIIPQKYDKYLKNDNTIFNNSYLFNITKHGIMVEPDEITINTTENNIYDNYSEKEIKELKFSKLLEIKDYEK